ncbi:NAD(P)-binding protein [Xylaria telfairii]|nr:NAD(P)-binding protein [Xylaria telfairii]
MATITGNAFITGGGEESDSYVRTVVTKLTCPGNGIGRSSAFALAKAGARALLISDIDLKAAEETAAKALQLATNPEIQVKTFELDVTIEEDVKKAVAYTVETFGRIDYCVHSAGIASSTFNPVSAADYNDFKRVLEVNVAGTFLILSTVSAAMKSQELRTNDSSLPGRGSSRGSIVTLGSLASVLTLPNMIPYNTAKHGVSGMSKTAAIDNIADGIRVNCVCPAWTATPMIEKANAMFPGLEQSMLQQLPMGRLALPEEIADVITFLCSPQASYVTGCTLIVDGGMGLGSRT